MPSDPLASGAEIARPSAKSKAPRGLGRGDGRERAKFLEQSMPEWQERRDRAGTRLADGSAGALTAAKSAASKSVPAT
jgi:hypothetical protein